MIQRDGATSDLGPGGDSVAHSPIDGPCATRFVTPVAIDLGFIIGLLAISAAPLVLLRGSDVLHHSGVLATIFIAWFGGVALWTIVVGRMGAGCAGPTDITAVRDDPRESRSRLLLAAALLFAFAVTAFFLPLRLHFWGGFDEFISLIDKGAVIWSDAVDTKMGRPLIGMQSFIASLLAPDRIEGVLYVAVGLCFLNALLLMGIIRRLLPGGVLIGMAAAVFFVVNRSEPLIFFVAWATNVYWMALFWFLLALYLLLVSHVRKSRWLLAVSCVSLGAALLTSEGLFPLTLLGPLLLYFQRGDARSRLLVWTSAWLGTVALFAIRFATYFLGGEFYQEKFLATAHPQAILVHAGHLLLGAGSYFSVPNSLPEHWGFWLLGFCLAAAAICSVQDLARRIRPGICLAGMATAALANILAIAPFVPLAAEWRSQYFAGAAQAVFVAFGIALLASVISQRFGRFAAAVLSTLIAANAAAQAWSSQESTRSTVRFEKTVHVFKQIHAIAPNLPRDTLLLFFLEEGSDRPLGVNYHVLNISDLVLGVPALQVNLSDPHGLTARFGKGDIEVSIWYEKVLHYRYDQLVAFRLSRDGTVALLDDLPESSSPGYAPFARLAAGPVGELRFLRYLSSSEKAVDVFDTETGIMFGRNWGELVDVGGQIGRWADNDAELIVNPAGRDRLELRFELDPRGMVPGRASELVVLGASGEILASALLQGERPRVRLEVPLERDRVTPLRLRIREAGDARRAPPGSFLVLSSEHKAAARWQRSAGSNGPEPSDIVTAADRLHLGGNWHHLESQAGQSFRWAANDAEILVDATPDTAAVVRLDLEGGPSFGGKPADLRILGEDGSVLAEAAVLGRRTIDVELPPAPQRRRVLRLHVEGGGLPIPGDPRILNFRVFRSWRPVDTAAPANIAVPADIVTPADRLHLGGNWHLLESQAGQSFRWAANDAEIVVDAAPDTSAVLRLDVEGGPSFGGKPADLRILGEDGSVLAEAAVLGRRTIDVELPPALQPRRVLRLHVEGGGLPIPGDPRILNFRVFRSWRPADSAAPANIAVPGDIVSPSDRLHLGSNWHQLESQAGQSFRWATNDAEILVDATPDTPAVVRLDLEGGPSFGGKSADLRILGEDGSILAQVAVLGRRTIDVELPPAPQRRRVLRLHVEGGGLPIPGDPRILNFRIFRSWRVGVLHYDRPRALFG